MPRKGARIRLDRGIYRDGTGIAAKVQVGEWVKEHRFPPNTPLKDIRQWQDDERRRIRHSGVHRTTRGTLAADVDVYLDRVKHLVAWVSLRSELRHWVKLFGDRRRHSLTTADVQYARQHWLTVPDPKRKSVVTPKTVNMRVGALNRLWHTLDGKRSVSPGDDIAPLAVHKTPIVKVRNADVLRVYKTLVRWEKDGRLRDAKTRARFMVYAACGRRPSEIMRAQPADVDLRRRVWTPRDGKGGWGPGVYLNDDMRAAWRVFIKAQAWGTFRTGSFVKTLRRAGWKGRPYNLRHTVGISMSERGADLADIQQHLGHTRIDTTRRHYVPVLGSRLQRASEQIDKRFRW